MGSMTRKLKRRTPRYDENNRLLELGYLLGQEGYVTVALDHALFAPLLKGAPPLCRWGRWHYVLLKDKVQVLYPVAEGTARIELNKECRLWSLLCEIGLTPFEETDEAVVRQIVQGVTAQIETDLRQMTPQQMADAEEQVHGLGDAAQGVSWWRVPMKSYLWVAMKIRMMPDNRQEPEGIYPEAHPPRSVNEGHEKHLASMS